MAAIAQMIPHAVLVVATLSDLATAKARDSLIAGRVRRRDYPRSWQGRSHRRCRNARAACPSGGVAKVPPKARASRQGPRRQRIINQSLEEWTAGADRASRDAMAGLKGTIIRGGLEVAVFHRRASCAQASGRRRRRDPDAASRAAAAAGPASSRTACSKSRRDSSSAWSRCCAARGVDHRQPRRDASPPDRARFQPPLRLPDVRRRLSRHAAMRLSDPQAIRGCRSRVYMPTSFPDRLGELWWLALEAVIARNDRIGLRDRRRRTARSTARPSRRSARSSTSSTGGCAAADRRPSCATSCAISRPAITSTSRRSATICA